MSLEELDALMDGLDEASADFAPAWEPEEGDTLIGTLVRRSSRDKGYGPYPILTVAANGERSTNHGGESVEDETNLAFHAFHTVAKTEIEEQDPSVGDFVAIRYKGEVPTEDGKRTYHAYVVRVA